MRDKGRISARGVTVGEISLAEDLFLAEGLVLMVRALVNDVNRMLGDDYLYFSEFASMWVLLAKREGQCDRMVANGFSNAADLSGLAQTLQKAVKKEIEL
ncbi:MAG: hypothetical protein IJC99_04110 [Clostridia bacterium]|nr:hypothetical protein [Clostridia bacterium]